MHKSEVCTHKKLPLSPSTQVRKQNNGCMLPILSQLRPHPHCDSRYSNLCQHRLVWTVCEVSTIAAVKHFLICVQVFPLNTMWCPNMFLCLGLATFSLPHYLQPCNYTTVPASIMLLWTSLLMSRWTCVHFFWPIPRSEFLGHWGWVCSPLMDTANSSHSGCTKLHSHRHNIRILAALQSS